MTAPTPSGRVLPTLNADGTRRWIRPRLYPGTTWRGRRVVAYLLMVTFLALPWLRVNGKPLVLLDIVHREFTLFGRTFLPTDGVLLMLLMLTIFLGIVLLTAVVGRAWCGWACPQTVYMEFLFRPLERWLEGPRERQLELDRKGPNARRILKYVVFAVPAVLLGNSFLAYFVGTDALVHWISSSPLQHPQAFTVMALVSLLAYLDFTYFREQMCTVVCPYARLQSVLLDRQSLLVGYDARRGEPRGKGKPRPGEGDCIDCSACVAACPTGIDIRQGLQLECIACAQCADACDSIMDKLKKPRGLIRYASQDGLETGKPGRLLRARTGIYAALLSVLLVALVATAQARGSAEVIVLRGLGAPFELRDGLVINQIRIKVRNRSSETRRYALELLDASGARLVAPELPLEVTANAQRSTTVFVMLAPSALPHGQRAVRFRLSDGDDFDRTIPYQLLGPDAGGADEGRESP